MTEQEYLDELIERYPCLAPMKEQIGHAYEILKEAYESGHKLLIAGNGGSAADSRAYRRGTDEGLSEETHHVKGDGGDLLEGGFRGRRGAV